MHEDTSSEAADQQDSKINKNDLILLGVSAISMAAGIMLPTIGIVFQPYLLVFLGFLLFLNLIRMDPKHLASRFKKPIPIFLLVGIKLVAIPLFLFAISNIFYPSLSIPILLLSGMSTGLGAPFVMNVFGKSYQLPLVVAMIISTSIAVPFILPTLVYLLADIEQFQIPFADMIILLAEALFLPLFAGWFVRVRVPTIATKIEKNSFVPSVILIAFMNLGIFAQFSGFFLSHYTIVITMTIASFVLFFIYGLIGYISAYLIIDKQKSSKVASFVIMSYVNNVLVVVFASQFFGNEVAVLAAYYNLSYYSMIIPLKRLFLFERF